MIITPLDSAELDSKEQYAFYHRLVDFVLKELLVHVQNEKLCNRQELDVFKQYSDLLLYSIEAMRVKYMYDTEASMKVDLTNSGFPTYLEFRYLFNDLSLRENFLKKLTDVEVVKTEILDQLLRNKKPLSKEKLFQAASIVYYTSVKKEYIFNRFVQGKIIDAPEGSEGKYMTSWGFYDLAHNRPFICYMYFDCKEKNIHMYKGEVYEVLKEVADREMALDTMAYTIDTRLHYLSPKKIKRLDLGPIHTIFAKDDNPVTHLILEGISKREIPLESYAVTLKIEETVSQSTFRTGTIFSSRDLQRWGSPVKQQFLLAPHRILQSIYSNYPEIKNDLTRPPIEMAALQAIKKTNHQIL